MQLGLNTYENEQFLNVNWWIWSNEVITSDLLTTLSLTPSHERVQTPTMSGYSEITYEMSRGKWKRNDTEKWKKDKNEKKAAWWN